MTFFTRRSKYGVPYRGQQSRLTQTGFVPVGGYREEADVELPLGSWASAANCWVRDGSVVPRSRLSQFGTNTPTVDVPVGAFTYDDVSGNPYPVVASKGTVSYFQDDGSWLSLTYASGVSNYPPSGGENDAVFGGSVYLPREDVNLGVFTNGVDPLFAWAGPSFNTAYSTLTEAPIAKDVCIFDNRPVAWNIRDLGTSNRYVTRVRWPVAGDPEDWNFASVGAGSDDLVDMRGEGTRIFAQRDQMVLASTQELWRGRKVGLPYVFQFSPINKNLGMPYPRAALQTTFGIFWLNDDYMIYLLAGEQVTPIGSAVRDTLRRSLQDPDKAFFSYDETLAQITLHYSVTAGQYPTRALTYHLDSQVWTPHTYAHQLVAATPANRTSSTVTTWQDLTGTIASQTLTYSQFLGTERANANTDIAVSSKGTAYAWDGTYGTDDGSSVTAYLHTGALFAGDPNRMKYADEVRLDMRADSASSLSVAVSGNLGGSYQFTNEVAFSVQSNSSQARMNPGVAGTYFAMRVQSDDTGWKLSRVFLRARDDGESL
jgi:hypothetical protein